MDYWLVCILIKYNNIVKIKINRVPKYHNSGVKWPYFGAFSKIKPTSKYLYHKLTNTDDDFIDAEIDSNGNKSGPYL